MSKPNWTTRIRAEVLIPNRDYLIQQQLNDLIYVFSKIQNKYVIERRRQAHIVVYHEQYNIEIKYDYNLFALNSRVDWNNSELVDQPTRIINK